jgi:hypothetical protein
MGPNHVEWNSTSYSPLSAATVAAPASPTRASRGRAGEAHPAPIQRAAAIKQKVAMQDERMGDCWKARPRGYDGP